MGGMRSLVRTVAMNKSYRQSHTTKMFQYFFTKLWGKRGYPAESRWNPAKREGGR